MSRKAKKKTVVIVPRREPNGRSRRPARGKVSEDMRSVVMAQPHRQGSGAEMRVWAIGRMIEDGACDGCRYGKSELHEAARLYATDYRNVQSVMASRVPYAVYAGGQGEDLTQDIAERFRRAWSSVCKSLADSGHIAKDAAEKVILDNPTADEKVFARWIVLTLPDAMNALCQHYGLPMKKAA